jgi:hypothetical protein
VPEASLTQYAHRAMDAMFEEIDTDRGGWLEWKKLISIVNSPSMGCFTQWDASRDRINHVHFRNRLVVKPYERYREL